MKRITAEEMDKEYIKRVRVRLYSLAGCIQKLADDHGYPYAESVMDKVNLKTLINKGHARAVKIARSVSDMATYSDCENAFEIVHRDIADIFRCCGKIYVVVDRVGSTEVAKSIRDYIDNLELDLFMIQLGDLSDVLEDIKWNVL